MDLLHWLDTHSVLVMNAAMAIGGYIVAMVTGYIKFGQDLSYIKGQLQGILNLNVEIKDLQKKYDIIEREIIQTVKELEKTGTRLQIIESFILRKES